jgi:hypothetical protein
VTALLPVIADNPLLPWRLRNGLERWTETHCRSSRPALYRWLHFGRSADPLVPVTRGPKHHFFGYYDKSPWNASERLMLAHEADFNDRPPREDDAVTIGLVKLEDGNRYERLATTRAWNWQQGAMLQWHPADPERLLVHNDYRDGRHVGIVRATDGREVRVYDRPVYAMVPDGRQAFSLSFARLQTHRPGYGYAGASDPWAHDPAPEDDGIHHIDLETGASRLIVSLGALARLAPKESMRGGFHYINHVQVSPTGGRLAFFHVWRIGDATWEVRLYAVDPDGGNLRCVLDTGRVSHYDWLDDCRILVWARHPGRGDRFLVCDEREGGFEVFGEGRLTVDGHCSFSPDRQWVLNDTYPDRYDMRTLMLVRFRDQQRVDLARLHSPKARWWGEIRCDLHPRWSRDGRRVCIDSVHDGTRQMYVMDVERWLK